MAGATIAACSEWFSVGFWRPKDDTIEKARTPKIRTPECVVPKNEQVYYNILQFLHGFFFQYLGGKREREVK